MRFPFFGPRQDHTPLRIPLPEVLRVGFGVYFRPGAAIPPQPEAVAGILRSWLTRRAGESIRAAVMEYQESGFVEVRIEAKDFLPPPPLELLRLFRSGEAEERRLEEATHLAVVTAADSIGPLRVGLWSAVAISRALAEALDGVILDPEFPRLLPLESVGEEIPPDGSARVPPHILVPYSVDDRGLAWLTTRGMDKFGLPELEIRDAPPNRVESLRQVINGMADALAQAAASQADGSGRPPGELRIGPELRFSVADMVRAGGGEGPAELPEGARGWTTVRLEYRPGKRDRASFVRLVPPRGFRGGQGVWLNALLTDLFGVERTLRQVQTDSEAMESAHFRAIYELPGVKSRFQAGLKPGEALLVKHGFVTGEDSHEYMWVVVNTWKGDRIRGQLANDPQYRLDLRAGQVLDLRETDIYDWLITHADGRMEGGYTNRVAETEGEED